MPTLLTGALYSLASLGIIIGSVGAFMSIIILLVQAIRKKKLYWLPLIICIIILVICVPVWLLTAFSFMPNS